VCTSLLDFLTYQLISKAILRHAAVTSFADATSVTKRAVPVNAYIGRTGVARKVLVCKIIGGPIHRGPSLSSVNLWGSGPQDSPRFEARARLPSISHQTKMTVKTKKMRL
jgi:hypothetical protein